jgi:hypothetical protein
MSRDRTDDQILAERDVIEKKIDDLYEKVRALHDEQRALGKTSQEQLEWDRYLQSLETKKKDKVRESNHVDPEMWELFSQGYQVKPFDRFNREFFLRQFRKDREIDWSKLIPAEDLVILKRYGFDDTGLRVYRKRLMSDIAKDLREEGKEDPQFHHPLDQIEAAIRNRAPLLQFDLSPLRERFAERWENRLKKAKGEPQYQEEGSPHKRKLEELEKEFELYQQKYPKRPRLKES